MINKSRPKILVDLEFKSREKLVLKNRSLDLYFNKYGNCREMCAGKISQSPRFFCKTRTIGGTQQGRKNQLAKTAISSA